MTAALEWAITMSSMGSPEPFRDLTLALLQQLDL
jgi:hypothetical protein